MPDHSEHSDRYYWVVVADDSKAAVYLRPSSAESLDELFALENRAESDDSGEAFAAEIAGVVRKALQDESCHGYALIAPPGFLGVLRIALAAIGQVQPNQAMDTELVRQAAAILKSSIDGD